MVAYRPRVRGPGAGAEASVSWCCRLAHSCAVRLGRGIRVCDGEGMKNLVVRSWSCKKVDWFMVVSSMA